MDRAVIDQKLESLRRCVQRVEDKLPQSPEELRKDLDAQDIVGLNLTRAVQICVDIAAHWLSEKVDVRAPKTMGQTFRALGDAGLLDEQLADRLRKAVGFRNIMIHSYEEIDWAIVHSIGRYQSADFRAFAQSVDRAL